MPEEATTTIAAAPVAAPTLAPLEPPTITAPSALPLPTHVRLRRGLLRRENWIQVLRFGVVGTTGYLLNVGTFAFLLHGVGLHYRLAACGAFVIAFTNNFWWNRHWTFEAHHRHAALQALRFFAVSMSAFLLGLALLTLLVDTEHVAKVPAQAMSILAVTPFSFLANRLWAFG